MVFVLVEGELIVRHCPGLVKGQISD